MSAEEKPTASLMPTEYTQAERVEIMLKNIIKMLIGRKMLDKEKETETYDKAIKDSTENIFKITTNDEKNIYIKIMLQVISSVSKNDILLTFLNNNINFHKILLVKSLNSKAEKQIVSNYGETEVFLEDYFMINLVDHILVPKHELLSDKEKDEFMQAYDLRKKNIPKISVRDPVSKYYAAKKGDIFRIIRMSETTGYYVTYRIVGNF